MSNKLEKFVREDHRQMIDAYTQVNAQLDVYLKRYNALIKDDLMAMDAGTAFDARDGVEGVTREDIMYFVGLLEALMAAQPDGSSDALLAQRVNMMRVG